MHDWHYFFNHVDDNLAASTYRIFEPHYKTKIFNWFSREDVGKEQKEGFIQALVDFPDDCGGFYRYRAYLLAAEAINYYKDCSLGDAIALQVLKWSYAFFRQDKQDWQIVPQPLVEAARAVVGKTDRTRVVSAFVHLVHTTESKTILRLAAEKLGKLDPGSKSAIAAITLLLQVTQNKFTIWKITRSLMQIDPENPAALSPLVALIYTKSDEWSSLYCHSNMINYAVDALGKVDTGNQIAIKALMHILQTTKDVLTFQGVVDGLCAIAVGNEAAIDTLLELIQTTADRYVCLYAVICLEKIASGNQRAIAALTEFLQINQGDRICVVAAQALWQIDVRNINAIATLVHSILTTTDGFLLHQAATYLVQFQPNNVNAISALIERIETTEDEHTRLQAAVSLLQFDAKSELAIATLLQIIHNSDGLRSRWEAAHSLVNKDPSNQIAINALFDLVQYLGQSPADPEYVKSIAYDATRSLAEIDSSKQLATTALVNLLNTAKDDTPLRIAVGDLGNFAFANPDAIAALTQLIASTEDNHLLLKAAYSLGRIDPGNQTAISTFIQFIQTFKEVDATEIYCAEDGRSRCNSQLLNAANELKEILPIDRMPQVVVTLKDYLSKSKRDSSYRYETCYNLIWHCAQNMPYLDFYKAWRTSS